MKTPEQIAEKYAKIVWDDSDLAPEDRAVERHVVIGAIGAKMGFLAGYKAASDKHFEQIRHLESELQQAKNLVMRLEAER
ncbi:hypothetical protein UFOVP410_131 [uncultured Caudovirales phage]|uniref:Uncharacterized protein n=1 Tax=uncultured Caudovirales phage TaxID=2100421 RepID=A0A6J5M552_9CAUD|nr:hypothetical protein UFOVP410_131 [uncultured Caudovirales phage]